MRCSPSTGARVRCEMAMSGVLKPMHDTEAQPRPDLDTMLALPVSVTSDATVVQKQVGPPRARPAARLPDRTQLYVR